MSEHQLPSVQMTIDLLRRIYRTGFKLQFGEDTLGQRLALLTLARRVQAMLVSYPSPDDYRLRELENAASALLAECEARPLVGGLDGQPDVEFAVALQKDSNENSMRREKIKESECAQKREVFNQLKRLLEAGSVTRSEVLTASTAYRECAEELGMMRQHGQEALVFGWDAVRASLEAPAEKQKGSAPL